MCDQHRPSRWKLCFAIALALAACSSDDTGIKPGADLGRIDSLVVSDTRGVDAALADAAVTVDANAALVSKIEGSLAGAWWWDCNIPQVYLLYNFNPESWGNLNVSSDSGVSFYRRYFDWEILNVKSEKDFLIDITWTQSLGGVNTGDKGYVQVSDIKSTDPLTYVGFNRVVGSNCDLVKCGAEWNTDQYCGKTHNLGLPEKSP